MTRFELAAQLSSRLFMLTEEERHNIINKYVNDINIRVENGGDETAAIAQLGDIDLLADRILARHHIDPAAFAKDEPDISADSAAEETDSEEEQKFTVKDTAEKAGTAVKETAAKMAGSAKDAAAKAESTVKDTAKKASEGIKGTTGAVGRFFSGLWQKTTAVTFSLINLIAFIFIWLPCMAITALAVICTAALIIFYIFSGIGFVGVCLAGLGCCVVGISFCAWLGSSLTGGKNAEQDI